MALPFALNLQSLGIAMALSGLLAFGAAWYVQGLKIDNIKLEHKVAEATMQAKVNKAEGDANALRLSFQTNLTDKKNELDKDYASRVANLTGAVSKLSTIKLRDPAAGRDSNAAGNQGSTQGSNGSTSGELSLETSQFLWSFAGDAEQTRQRLAVCQQWNAEVTKQSQTYYDEILRLQKANKP